ncbi:hypothetical protein L4D09_28360 [Photobacterium makurazakiensis]|uniref:hypothetical protein n=1 Tax=Photobacterium makurazakiensis TaxID=2910234 RepID=UPI003D0BCDCD
MHLPKGTYTAKQPVTIYGMSWSGAPDPVSKIQLDVNLDFNIEQDSIELGSWSENYALSQPSQKSVFFYVPPQDIVLSADASNPGRGLWAGTAGTSFFEVKVINDQGQPFTAKIRGNKNFRGRNIQMNDGVQNGYGAFKATVNAADNPELPAGNYRTEESVIIYAQSWSGAPKPVKALKLNVDFSI